MEIRHLDVVIPCHNYGRYLAEAIESALAQIAFEVRVIVVDDASTDNTAEVVAGFDDATVIGLRIDQPSGAANARNIGASRSDSDFLAFLDADDLWPPERSRVLAELLSGTDSLPCGVVEEFSVNGSGEIVPAGFVRSGTSLGAMLMRRETFERIGLLDTSFSLGENIDWLSRARQLGVELVTTDAVTLRRRVHGGNTTTRSASDRSDYLKVIRAHRARLEGS